MVHRDDDRADLLRGMGAEVVVGDLTDPRAVVDAMRDTSRMYFNMSVSQEFLRATAVVCAAAREHGRFELVVNMSELAVSQMTLTSTKESRQQRSHWLSEQIINWSGIPVAHVRPTAFLDNPIFTTLARRRLRERDVLELPLGTGRTSPIAAADVARVVETLLTDPAQRVGQVYELTGPEALDLNGFAEQFARALKRPIRGEDIDYDEWIRRRLRSSGLPEHNQQHIATSARLHREGRYNRTSDDVEKVTRQPAMTVEQFVTAHPEIYG